MVPTFESMPRTPCKGTQSRVVNTYRRNCISIPRSLLVIVYGRGVGRVPTTLPSRQGRQNAYYALMGAARTEAAPRQRVVGCFGESWHGPFECSQAKTKSSESPAMTPVDDKTSSSQVDQRPNPAEERRRSLRYLLRDAPGMLDWCEGAEQITCGMKIIDISGWGAAILADRRPTVNQPVRIRLASGAHGSESEKHVSSRHPPTRLESRRYG